MTEREARVRVTERAARVRVLHRGVRHRLAGAPPRPGRARVRRQGLPALHRDPRLQDCRVPCAPRHLRLDRLVHLHQVVRPGRAVSQPHHHQGRPARAATCARTSPRRTTATSRLVTSPPGPPAPSRPQLACRRFYELLAATAEALADRSSACRRQGPPRTAPSAASRRRPRAPWCPAPARPPPSRPIVAFSLGLGALKRALTNRLIKTSTLQTGLLFGFEPERSSV